MSLTGRRGSAAGFTMIELIMFIVIVSVALTASMQLFTQATARSADPMLRRQALAIAESVLEEVELMPYTWCDPDDANLATASSAAGCASQSESAMAAESGETRYATPQFDNVNDYNGFSMSGIKDITNTAVSGLSGYSASVVVAAAALNTITAASGDALRITVTVTDPAGNVITLDGYRSRYAPNAAL